MVDLHRILTRLDKYLGSDQRILRPLSPGRQGKKNEYYQYPNPFHHFVSVLNQYKGMRIIC